MTSVNALDLKAYILNAVGDVFDTMLSMEVQSVEGHAMEKRNRNYIVGSVGFAGKVMGNLNLCVEEAFARRMTAAMLDIKIEDSIDESEIHDVIGELCNMICGGLKSRLCDYGLACELSIPSVTVGKEFKIEPKGWDRSERYEFCNHQDTARVETYIKSGN
jgi:chemotaxis protein CheX